MIGRLHGTRPQVSFEPWRTGDQRYYVSDTTAFTRATGWRQRVTARAGIEALHGWLVSERARTQSTEGVIRA
jgi:CDP-paratose 2-epimerase